MSGLFVVLEGGDGVGKSTQLRAVSHALRDLGHDVVATHQPGATAAGQQIRAILLDPATGNLSPRAEALLYAADKAHHVDSVVRPALERGAVVVCDRYVDSMLAYQGAGRALDLAEVEHVARWSTGGLRPDLTVLLDMEPNNALADLTIRDRLEDAGDEFHSSVRDHFLALAAADPGHYLVVAARDDPAAITDAILRRIVALLDDVSAS